MPGFDATGPRGMGPMTGRGMGYCATPVPPSTLPNQPATLMPASGYSYGRPRWGMQLGRGIGRGRGRGFGRRYLGW